MACCTLCWYLQRTKIKRQENDNEPAVLTFSAVVNGCGDASPSRMSVTLVRASTSNQKLETNGIVPQAPTITQHGKLIKR